MSNTRRLSRTSVVLGSAAMMAAAVTVAMPAGAACGTYGRPDGQVSTCNPLAAPCSPCGAKCSPCAAKCSPCSPCGAKCSPCGGQ